MVTRFNSSVNHLSSAVCMVTCFGLGSLDLPHSLRTAPRDRMSDVGSVVKLPSAHGPADAISRYFACRCTRMVRMTLLPPFEHSAWPEPCGYDHEHPSLLIGDALDGRIKSARRGPHQTLLGRRLIHGLIDLLLEGDGSLL